MPQNSPQSDPAQEPPPGSEAKGCGVWHDLLAHHAEFLLLAERIGMPPAEQAGILGITEATLAFGAHGLRPRSAESLRRLGYAIPLMRRLLQNL